MFYFVCLPRFCPLAIPCTASEQRTHHHVTFLEVSHFVEKIFTTKCRRHGFKTVPPASGMGGKKEIVMLSYILVVG